MTGTDNSQASPIADDPELSTEEASAVLGMSQSMVVQRIELGDLVARMVGTHHRILKSDLSAFQEREAERAAALAELGESTDQMTTKHTS